MVTMRLVHDWDVQSRPAVHRSIKSSDSSRASANSLDLFGPCIGGPFDGPILASQQSARVHVLHVDARNISVAISTNVGSTTVDAASAREIPIPAGLGNILVLVVVVLAAAGED